MYRVSPQLFVTKEHIISDSASTSSSGFSSWGGAGDAAELWGDGNLLACCREGLEPEIERGWLTDSRGVSDGGVVPLGLSILLSANLFSSILRSVRSTSSSFNKPESFSKASIRPSRFSKPSMYFALRMISEGYVSRGDNNPPFRWSALLFDVGENAFSLVVDAVGTRRCLPIAFDLLLPAHITGLDIPNQRSL